MPDGYSEFVADLAWQTRRGSTSDTREDDGFSPTDGKCILNVHAFSPKHVVGGCEACIPRMNVDGVINSI